MHHELLTGSRRDAITAPMLREWLEPLGLTEITPRRWIDGLKPPARRLFELWLGRAHLTVCWGFSLDFVPHVSGGSIRWHRSDKSAKLDVVIQPAELLKPCYLFGPERFRDDLPVFANQHSDARFGLFELFAAGFAQSHTALEQLQRALQREVAPFELLDDCFELIETGLECFRWSGVRLVFRHLGILTGC